MHNVPHVEHAVKFLKVSVKILAYGGFLYYLNYGVISAVACRKSNIAFRYGVSPLLSTVPHK